MTFQELLVSMVSILENAGIGTARLDALVILEVFLGKDRSYLLAHPEMEISTTLNTKITQALQRRAAHEPLAYILGKTEFYGRDFIVNKHVLVPRPESETMIELLKTLSTKTIVDVGTGSGALAITAKLELPKSEVIAIDIDPNCIDVAKRNAEKHKADIKFYQGNLLEPVLTSNVQPLTSILLCNLPYVPDSHTINQAALLEPKLAIFGGEDGLDLYRQLFIQVKKLSVQQKYILTESLPFQHVELAKIAKGAGYKLTKTDDFIQLFTAG